MENIEKIKVLWVDDQVEIGVFEQGFRDRAIDDNGIDLVQFPNWQDAEKKLKEEFEDFSAIILDAECIYEATDNRTSSTFIPKVVTSLATIFAEKREFIPWYILSAGTMSNFDYAIEVANDKHAPHQEEWGNMVYLKTDGKSIDELFSNIKKVAKNKTANIVAYNFQNVFKYLGEDKRICKHARKIMMDMLCAFYYPAENWNFKYEGNPLRKVMEYIFRAANKYDLLPGDFIDKDGKVNMFESNRYMSGMNTKYEYGIDKINLRYGTEGDTIFSELISNITLQLLNFTNALSHTHDSDKKPSPYTIDDEDLEITENEKELFFSYVLQLCHVIKFFGDFMDSHLNKEENREKRTKIVPLKRALIQKDENGLYIGPLPKRFEEYVGKSAKIGNVNPNTKDDNTEYPYFAGIKIGK